MWDRVTQAVANALYQALVQYGARFLGFIGAGVLMTATLAWGVLPAGFEWFWDQLPESLQGQFGVFYGAFVFANYWFPVGELFVILLATWTFLIAYIITKLFIKIFLPTLG